MTVRIALAGLALRGVDQGLSGYPGDDDRASSRVAHDASEQTHAQRSAPHPRGILIDDGVRRAL